jgi:hypothetical protein
MRFSQINNKMPDITMCTNEECPLSYSCWRFNCPPSQHAQSYQKIEPQIDEVLDEVECKFYIKPPKEICYKTNQVCKYDCPGVCRDSV